MAQAMETTPARNPLLSVVMATYNGQEFLGETLDSILGQTFTDFELVIVDDGSTDGTPALLAEYAQRDGRIRVLPQENQGVSAARNAGMDAARGTYVQFFDDDDWLEPTAYEKLVGQLEQDGADLCVCGGFNFDMSMGETRPTAGYLSMNCVPEERPFTPEQAGARLFNFTNAFVFNKVYRLEALRDAQLRFRPLARGEDLVFVTESLPCINSITVVDERLVTYRLNSGMSIMDGVADDILAGHRALLCAKQVLEQKGLYDGELRQSFVNRALENTLHFRWLASTPEAFELWHTTMANGGLAELDILGHDEEYFHKASSYEQLQELLDTTSTYRYLFTRYRKTLTARGNAVAAQRAANADRARLKQKNAELRNQKSRLKERKEQLQETVKGLREQRRTMKERNAQLKERNSRLEGQASDLQAEVERLSGANAKLEAELSRIKASRSYRFALKLHAVAKKLGMTRK